MRRRTPDPELDALERRAHVIGDRIGAPRAAYPPFGLRLDAGYPNVDRRDGEWVWEVHERGQLLERRTTREEDDVLYWIFVDVTRWMGSEWAKGRPRYEPDTRVTWAGRILELLADLDPRWLERFLREEDSWLSTVRWPDGRPDPYRGSRARRLRRRFRRPGPGSGPG